MNANGTSSEIMGRRSPLSEATGRGVRIAVIDSGVNVAHPHIGHIAGGASITATGWVDESQEAYLDHAGHGTAVMAAIQEMAPDAEYLAVRVFDVSLRTSASAIMHAINWCIRQKVDVINLSLGTLNRSHAAAFGEAAQRASEQGILLSAAKEIDGQPCYPGCLAGVFGVELDWDCPRGHFRCGGEGKAFVLRASGYPRPAPGVPPARNLQGISFAVANATAFIVRACELEHSARQAPALPALVRQTLQREGSWIDQSK